MSAGSTSPIPMRSWSGSGSTAREPSSTITVEGSSPSPWTPSSGSCPPCTRSTDRWEKGSRSSTPNWGRRRGWSRSPAPRWLWRPGCAGPAGSTTRWILTPSPPPSLPPRTATCSPWRASAPRRDSTWPSRWRGEPGCASCSRARWRPRRRDAPTSRSGCAPTWTAARSAISPTCMAGRRPGFSPVPGPCCCPCAGRSRSGWRWPKPWPAGLRSWLWTGAPQGSWSGMGRPASSGRI